MVEHVAIIWHPNQIVDTKVLEAMQRYAARLAKNDYYEYNSIVTQMLRELGWMQLVDRWRDLHLALLYKIVHGQIKVPTDNILIEVDSRKRVNHNYKYKHITVSMSRYRNSFFPGTIKD